MEETRFENLQRDLNREFAPRRSLMSMIRELQDWIFERLERQGLRFALEDGR